MDERTEALARRVEALERQAGRHRAFVVLALGLMAGAGLAWGQAGARPADVAVQARRFVLMGEDGAVRAALETTAGGAPRLSLLAGGGVPRLVLSLAADGSPSVALRDATGRERVRLEAAGEEARISVTGMGRSLVTLANGGSAPRLGLADAAGNDRLWVALRLGSPTLQFIDERGRVRSGLTTFNDDGGVAVMSATERPTPGLVLYGKDRAIVWSAP